MGQPWGNDRVEHDLRAARIDPLDGPSVLHEIHGEVILADDLAAARGHELPDLLVHHARPDVVRGRKVETTGARLPHEPRDEGLELLGRDRARAEKERVVILALVLLRVDV